MMAKTLRLCLGILLIPVSVGYAMAFYEQLTSIQRLEGSEIIFLLGVTAYLAFHVLVKSPDRLYVFGHEMTHAAAAWVSGGQVKGFKVGKNKGSVATNKVTAFIALAPYLIPVYSILWAFLYGAASLFWSLRPWASWFFFGMGITLAFHLVFTINVLKQKQSDLEVTGPVLALALIFWTNLSLVVGVMSLMLPEVRFSGYLAGGFHHSRRLYQGIFTQLFS